LLAAQNVRPVELERRECQLLNPRQLSEIRRALADGTEVAAPRRDIADLGRAMADEVPNGRLLEMHGFCGSTFFDAFASNPARRVAYIHRFFRTKRRPARSGAT
jgi:hypothetical protein